MSSPVHGASGDTMKTNTTVSIGAAARADSSTATLPSRPLAAASRAFHRADALDANPATPVRTRAPRAAARSAGVRRFGRPTAGRAPQPAR
ncbi:hypothetical protein WK26_03170 [Burkholderia vietnamiensis]|nr:hypothetical protein WI92_00485 [Burkholderia vietnamiensis]KVE68258.1 hypothetical protein WI96_07200 [Burkholderia vietnamiensis]KVE70408.1 hypothetical protein WI97_04420 [Burkholderia vietnamiensis]KVF33714.1 hypothetical protein WJ09_14920 [Burkholderia vietnamiensis]KVF95968.1 hypothetical protein WJ21_21390 [Burkholderia vietnamiensis]